MQNNGAWRIQEKDCHSLNTNYEKIIFLLRYGMLAPSMHNTQPWSIMIRGTHLVFTYKKHRMLPIGDSDNRGYFFSIGCFIENMTIAGNRFGWIIDNPVINGRKIAISCKKAKHHTNRTVHDLSLEGIILRKTNRSKYQDRKIPSKVNSYILSETIEGVTAQIINGSEKDRLARVIGEGSYRALSKKAFRRELSQWLIREGSLRTVGMPMSVFNFPSFLSYFIPFILPFFPKAGVKAQSADFEMVKKFTPSILIISSEKNTSYDWLNAGRLFQRISVYSAENGLYCHPLYGGVYDQNLRGNISRIYCHGRSPQFISRIGYPFEDRPHTPRDDIEKHIIRN